MKILKWKEFDESITDKDINKEDLFNVELENGEKYNKVKFTSIDSFITKEGKTMMNQKIYKATKTSA